MWKYNRILKNKIKKWTKLKLYKTMAVVLSDNEYSNMQIVEMRFLRRVWKYISEQKKLTNTGKMGDIIVNKLQASGRRQYEAEKEMNGPDNVKLEQA